MSFQNPTSEIYFMNVPFSNDYKNIIDFSSKSEQESEFKKLAGKHFTNVNIIRKNRSIEIKGDFGEYYKYNYIMFRNPELDSKWWYAFIIDSNYTSSGTTNIIFEIDVWQTFQFDITYYRCMIERGIVPRTSAKAESTGITIDGYKTWTQQEPLNVNPIYSKKTDIFTSINWEPYFCIESISRATSDGSFEYGGSGTGDNYSSVYMFPIGNTIYTSRYSNTVKRYGSINDNRSDLIDIRVIPTWITQGSNWGVTGNANESYSDRYISANPLVQVEDSVSISTDKLANGYKPRNKKMLGSLSRAFVLFNFNGLNVIIQPELLHSDDIIKVSMNARPVGMQSIRLIVNSIDNINEHYFDIPYNLTFDVAYNSNTGVQKALGVISSSSQLIGGLTKAVSGVAGIATGVATGGAAYTAGLSSAASSAQLVTGASQVYSGGGGILSGIADMFSGGISLAQSLSEKTAGRSSVPDLLHYRAYNMTLRLNEYCPSLTDCRVIDQFLDMYGYSINETGYLNAWCKTRSNWNYVKTTNCNLKVKGSATYEQVLKNMFNNGVTIWHGFDVFGNYNQNRGDGETINK